MGLTNYLLFILLFKCYNIETHLVITSNTVISFLSFSKIKSCCNFFDLFFDL
jgi:hypothetical protein